MKKNNTRCFVAGCAAILFLAACGKLSKDDARALMQAKFYDKDDNVYCTSTGTMVSLEGASGGTKQYAFIDSDESAPGACINELDASGIIKKGKCISSSSSGCSKLAFDLGTNVDVTGVRVRFPCGKKQLGEVTSVSTEGKKATAKYTRTITRDDALTKKLSDCAIDGPKAGTEDQSRGFIKDDDGNWSPVE